MSKITIYSPPATAQIKACAVDFDLRRAPVPVHLVQYDKTIPILAVSLYKGSSPYTLPADAEVNVRMNKRNNLYVYNPALGCNESRDMVYVAVTPQMTTQDGTFEPILEVVINSGVAGTSPLQLVIRRNPVQEDAIEDTSEAKTLTELVSQAAASATAAAQSASAAAASAQQAAGSAADARKIKDSMPADYTTMSGDVGTLKNQMQRAYPDDSTVGEKPWSSKHIIDMLCPPLEESGNPVVCYPVSGYPLNIKAKLEPVQEGSGTPYPAGGGKNQLNPAEYEAATKTINGITFTRLNTGKVVVNGTATGTAIYILISNFSYGVSLSTDKNWSVVGENVISAQGLVSGVTILKPSDSTRLYIRVESGIAVKTTVQPQIEKGNTPTTWAPYENIRPIKGRDSVKVERCGENLLKNKGNQTIKGVTWSFDDEGFLTINGSIRHDISDYFFFGSTIDNPEAFTAIEDMILSSNYITNNGNNIFGVRTNNGMLGNLGKKEKILIPSGTKVYGVFMRVLDATVDYSGIYAQLEFGSTQTAYKPYRGDTLALTLPSTIYGGEVDAVTGDGNENTKIITLDGTTNKFILSGAFWNLPQNSSPGIRNGYDTNCSHFPPETFGGNQNKGYLFTKPQLMEKYFQDVNAFNAYLAAQYAAGTPVQIYYKLAEPVPFTATGAQPIPALAGVNTMLTDADSATVTGRADPIKRIADLEDAVASQT